jgi:hypothetical protein
MRRALWMLLTLALVQAADSPAGAAAQKTAIVVELFTSEGCSDCPPADTLLATLVAKQPAGAQVIGLGEHVDYWDRQGWKDRFSSATLTDRQQIYGAHFRLDSVYTPQMVVDGQTEFVGSDSRSAASAIERAIRSPHASVRIDVDDADRPAASGRSVDARSIVVRVTVSNMPPPGRGEHADVVVAVTEDHLRSNVTAGENHGRSLSHTAVVRSMTTIGPAVGEAPVTAQIPIAASWNRDELNIVAFVQEQHGRSIVGAAAMPLRR